MGADYRVYTAILGMALATYATRIGGVLIIGRINNSARLQRALRYLPGSLLISLVIPVILEGAPTIWTIILITGLAAFKTKNLVATMAAGVGLVFLSRSL